MDGAANFAEGAAAGADIVAALVGFEVLGAEVEADVAASGGLRGGGVVFDVVGAEAKLLIADFDIALGDEQRAFAALLAGFELDHAAAGRKTDLSTRGGVGEGGDGEEQKQKGQPTEKRQSAPVPAENGYSAHAQRESASLALAGENREAMSGGKREFESGVFDWRQSSKLGWRPGGAGE